MASKKKAEPTVADYDIPEDPETGAPLFEPVDEPPHLARKQRGSKYDAVIRAAFSRPTEWLKLLTPFTSPSSAAYLRKRYADWTDDDDNVVHVRCALDAEDGNYYAYVMAGPVA